MMLVLDDFRPDPAAPSDAECQPDAPIPKLPEEGVGAADDAKGPPEAAWHCHMEALD